MSASTVPNRLIEFEEFTSIPTAFFKTIGVTAVHQTNKKTSRTKQWCLNILFAVSFLNTVLCWLGEITYLCMHFSASNFVDLTSLVLCIGFLFLAFVKLGTIIWKHKELKTLVLQLEQMFPQTHEQQMSFETARYAAHAKRLMIVYSWVQMVMIWLFSLYPLADSTINYVRRDVWKLDFPYLIWYPFDPYVSGWFVLNYLSQTWAAFFSATAILATDILLCGLVLQMCMHYDRLAQWLTEYRPNGECHSAIDYMTMTRNVRLHNTILRMSVVLDDIFGVCVLLNLVSSVVIVCVLGFLVVTADQSVELLKYFLTLITCTGQIFMVCLLGEIFIDSVSVSVCGWE